MFRPGEGDTEWPETTMEQGVGSPLPDRIDVNFSEKNRTFVHSEWVITNSNEKNAQRDANTARALAVVRFGHRRPPVANTQTQRQDRLQYTAPQLASAQCKYIYCGCRQRETVQ